MADSSWRADAGEPDVDLVAYLDERLKTVLGSSDPAQSAVLGSVVAHVIAQRYLMLISGEPGVLGDLDSPLLASDNIKI
jgi:hypothetical protein